MTETELLRQQIAAQQAHIRKIESDNAYLSTALYVAQHATRMAQNMFVDEFNAHKRTHQLLAQYQHYNATCAALGIQPVALWHN